MNDYWNDPPEPLELPECCGLEMDLDTETGVLTCASCGATLAPQPEPEGPDPEPVEPGEPEAPPRFFAYCRSHPCPAGEAVELSPAERDELRARGRRPRERDGERARPPFPRYEPHYCQEMQDRWQSLPMTAARHKDWVEKGTTWYRCLECGKEWEVGR